MESLSRGHMFTPPLKVIKFDPGAHVYKMTMESGGGGGVFPTSLMGTRSPSHLPLFP